MQTEDFLPERRDLAALRRAAKRCEGCDLYLKGTQTVFGEGDPAAAIVLVGEQPGDQEDRSGHPFVGPAGQLLRRALVEAAIDIDDVYVTNAVKHFNWKPAGKRRLHQKPGVRHIRACSPWLEAELEAIEPRVVVCLGATAAQAVLGKAVKISEVRGEVLHLPHGPRALVTTHPSALLRMPDEEMRAAAFEELVKDLVRAAEAASSGEGATRHAEHHGQAPL